MTTQTQKLRQLLQRPGMIRSLAAHDVFSAQVMQSAGLELLFLGGFGTAASLLGLPDVGLLTMSEMADALRRMTARIDIPVIADGDNGHGDLRNVARTVDEFERAGNGECASSSSRITHVIEPGIGRHCQPRCFLCGVYREHQQY